MGESLKVCSQCVTYDLDDVGSALLFGAMILSLKDNLDSETESARVGASSMVAGDLAWRADRVTPPDERDAYEDDSSISTWVVGVRSRPSHERDRQYVLVAHIYNGPLSRPLALGDQQCLRRRQSMSLRLVRHSESIYTCCFLLSL